jgi:hypothetical protein
MPSVTFYTGAGQNAFTTATRVYGPIPEYPFKRDLTAITWRETWWQTKADYVALALDTAHGTLASTYLVSEENHADVGGGVMSWDRVYSTIPATRTDPFGTYAYLFPAVAATPAGAQKTISSVAGNVYTSVAHGLSAGDYVAIYVTYAGGTTSARGYLAAVSTDTFTITLSYRPSGAFVSGTVQEIGAGRTEPETIPSSAIEVFSYALPGVTSGVSSLADFRADDLFTVIDSVSGMEVDTVTSGTIPSLADYLTLISSGGYVVAESGVETYLGNILQRRSLLVQAK